MKPAPKYKLLVPTVAVGAAILVFLMLVWPTPYRSEQGAGRHPERHRINRFTGKSEVYDADNHAWTERKRGRSNTEVTGGAGYGGPEGEPGGRSAGRPAPKGKNWWYEDSPGSKKAAGGDQWWYQDKKEAKAKAPKDDNWWHD